MGQSVEHFQVSTKRKVKVRVIKYNKLDSFSETLSQKAELLSLLKVAKTKPALETTGGL